jgi:MoxR-like ATPase
VNRFVQGFVHPGEPGRSLVLIDEVDKAPRDFPNDILREVEQMRFDVPELETHFQADPAFRPIVIITSNSERQLPAAFLRRCVYHHIPFPAKDRLRYIVSERLGENFPQNGRLLSGAVELFYELRADALNLRKRPSTSELLGWLVALREHFGDSDADLSSKPDFVVESLGCVVKDPEDLSTAEKRIRQLLAPAAAAAR